MEELAEEAPIPITSSQDGCQSEVIKERSVAGLLARLKSYASLPWSMKPIEVSPLVCARHGWLSREPDTLNCVACGATLCVRLSTAQTADNYGQQLMDMVTSLARSHSDDCPWQSDPMPDDTQLLPFTDPDADLLAFLKISESLVPISSAVGANVRFTIHCPVVRDLTEFVRSRSDRLLAQPEAVRLKCCLLAVAGWSPADVASSSPQQPPRLLCCCFCQRRVGLWCLNRAGGGAADALARQQLAGSAAAAATVVIDDASLSDGVEAGMSLGAGGGGVGGSMPAPSYALTEMIINRQLLFAKKQHSVSDWSLISNAGSEPASIRDLDDVQSVAGSTVSNVSASELANQLQDVEQQQQHHQQQAPGLSLLNLPPSAADAVGGVGDPDNWSTMTNPDSDRRSVAQSDVASIGVGDIGEDGNGGGGGGVPATNKRPRLDGVDDSGSTASAAAAVSVDLLALHWPWCPWRPGDPSEDWCRSVLSHPDLRQQQADSEEASGEPPCQPQQSTPQPLV